MSILNFILILIQIIKILNQDDFIFPKIQILLKQNRHFFERYVSQEILGNDSYQICNNSIASMLDEDGPIYNFSNIFFFSGKDTNDIGSERECLDRKGDYIIIGYNHYKDNLFYNNKIDRIKLLSFLYQPINFIGMCFQNCSDFLINVFFSENPLLYVAENDLKIHIVYKNYTLNEKKIKDNNINDYYDFKNAKYPILIIIFSIIGIKIIAKGIQIHFYPRGYELEGKGKIKIKDFNISFSNSINSCVKNDVSQIENRNISNSVTKKSKIEEYLELYSGDAKYNREFDRQSLFSKKIRFLKYLDIFDNFKVLIGKYNRYYNSVGLEKLIFIRFIIMFILTYIHIVIVIINFPYRDNYDFDIFNGLETFVYKLFNNGTTFYIIIEGSIFSYKLMCELDKNRDSPFYILKKFILLSIPKMIFFYLSFFFFKYFYFYFISLSETTQVFNYYHHFLIMNRKCLNYTYKLFIPFIFPLQDFQSTLIRENEEENFCYEYVNIMYNEYHCFIIMLLLFIISYKLKKKKFDKLMTTFIFILFIIFQILIFLKGEDHRKIGLYKKNPILENEMSPKYSTGEHDFFYKLYIFLLLCFFII